MKINNLYKISENNYYTDIFPKEQIILAGSGRANLKHIIHNNNKLDGNFKGWSTYTIDRDGTVYEHYDPIYYSNFMSEKEIDKKSISIVLANMGWVSYDLYLDKYIDWSGTEICEPEAIHEREWKQYRYWEKYTTKQTSATLKLCKELCEKFNIQLNTFAGNSHVQYVREFQGVTMRSHYDKTYYDLNPSFDFKRLYRDIAE